jgi:hypothetical protein
MPILDPLTTLTLALSVPWYAGLITRVNRWAPPQVRDGP